MDATNYTQYNSSTDSDSTIDCSNLLFKYLSLTIFLSLIYATVIVFSLIGNALIIYIVVVKKSTRSSTNIYLVNLAVCGIGIVCFMIPKKISEVFTGQWVWLVPGDAGFALCKITLFLHNMFIDCSTYTLLLVTFDRFRAVIFPHKHSWHSTKAVFILILSSWILSTAMNAKFLENVQLHRWKTGFNCHPHWKSHQEYYGYVLTFIMINIILPIILITFAYAAIFRKLKKQVQILGNSISDQHKLQESLRQRKIVHMAFAIVCCFAICWFPFALQVIIGYTAYVNVTEIPCPFIRFREVSYYFFVLVSVTNPAICFAFGTTFKDELRRILRNIHRCCCARGVTDLENTTDTELN